MSHRGQITDAPLYNEERELLGIVDTFTIPALETNMIERKGLGAVAVLQLPARGLQAMSATIKLQYPERELTKKLLRPNKTASFHLHEKVDLFDIDGHDEEASTTLITHVKAMCSKVESGETQLSEPREFSAEMQVHYLMQRMIDSETPIVEVDIFSNIYRVNGEDVWPA